VTTAAPSVHRGFDAFNSFVAAQQTGFGAFVPLYLAGNAWTQAQIGLALSVDIVTSMLCQVPGGMAVDAARQQRRTLLAVAVALTGVSALVFAMLPVRLPVLLALVLHAAAGSLIYPAINAVSLDLVGHAALGDRLGRNARYASIGNGLGAALMGACGSLWSDRAVFLLTAALAVPAVWSLWLTRPQRRHRQAAPRPHPPADRPPVTASPTAQPPAPPLALFRDRRLLVFAACVALFHLSSAAIVPVAASEATRLMGLRANLIIAAFIIVPQITVALFSPTVGRLSAHIGRRPLLCVGFLSLPLRAVCFALIADPYVLIAVQVLEGVASATYGVLVPLIAADLTYGTGRYNLTLGVLGLVSAGGAAASTTLAGLVASSAGLPAAFAVLGGIGFVALVLVVTAMPETR
jgi:MFS family permease